MFEHRHASGLRGLRPCPIEPTWITEGNPQAEATSLFRSADGLSNTVLWTCTPGKFGWYYQRDETPYVVSGKIILDEGLASECRVQAGDSVYFPAGSQVSWHITETVVKIAIERRHMPAFMVAALKVYRFIRRRNAQSDGMFGAASEERPAMDIA